MTTSEKWTITIFRVVGPVHRKYKGKKKKDLKLAVLNWYWRRGSNVMSCYGLSLFHIGCVKFCELL